MRQLLLALIIFQLSFSTALAQTDTSSFFIRVFGSDDIIPPSTPVLTTATPLASDQVDISWTAATDNYLVSGYVLYRDGVPVATTSLTSYSDIGLIASTTYTYFVQAFDPSFNYSSSSNSLSAFTPLPPPPVVPGTDTSGGTASRVVLNNLTITPDIYLAKLSLQTARPARFSIRWGRSNSYELGYTVNDSYVRSYTTTLTGLEPGTRYEYEVIGYTPLGAPTVLERGNFTTLSAQDFLPPANVSQFTATVRDRDVALSWKPPQEVYRYVRVVRSHLRFPTHLEDGIIVYQGTDTSLIDTDALKEYSPAYYSVFVVDVAGNVSSGAVARVYFAGEGVTPGSEPVQPPVHNGGPVGGQTPASASTSPNVPVGTRMPGLAEIFLTQLNEQQSFANNEIVLDAETSFLISIPKSVVSENLKTIIVSLTDPSDSKQSYSFILRINKDNTAYEAVLSALNLEGQSRIIVDIYDYESLVVATYQKTISFKRVPKEVAPIFPDLLIKNTLSIAPIIGVGSILLLLIAFLFRRRKKSV